MYTLRAAIGALGFSLLLAFSPVLNVSYAQCDLKKTDGKRPTLQTEYKKIGDYRITTNSGVSGGVRMFSQSYAIINEEKEYSGIRISITVDSYKEIDSKAIQIYFYNREYGTVRENYLPPSKIKETEKRVLNKSIFRIRGLLSESGSRINNTISYDGVEKIEIMLSGIGFIEIDKNYDTIIGQVKCINSLT
jgi:hypothetical protein